MTNLDPIPVSVFSEVYGVIRRGILDLTLPPGSAISENLLAQQLGVSRTPIRQALQRLELERLVFVAPQRGSFVAPLDLREFHASYFIRVSLECAAAAEAARRAKPDNAARLRRAVDAQRRVVADGDDAGFFALNDEFHIDIMTIAGVPSVWRAVREAKVHLDRVRAAHLAMAGDYPLAPIVEEHAEITDAISRNDSVRAGALMHSHVAKVQHRVDRLKDLRPDLFETPKELAPQARSINPDAATRRKAKTGK